VASFAGQSWYLGFNMGVWKRALSVGHEHHDKPGETLSGMKVAASPAAVTVCAAAGAPVAAAAVADAVATAGAAAIDTVPPCVHTPTSSWPVVHVPRSLPSAHL
jgi:hypothetical protein